jgi:dimethylglycine dehydrogenase
MQEAHRRWFERHLPASGVEYRNFSDDLHGIGLSGPQSRALLQRISREDVSGEAFKFRDVRHSFVAGVPVIINRVSFSGELGYEIYVAPPYQLRLAEAIDAAGADLGLRWYGARALMSLRLEKNWGVWTLDYRPDFTPAESGLDAFIDWSKDFIGKQAALTERPKGPKRRLVIMTVGTSEFDITGDEAVLVGDKVVGHVSSGGYAHYVGKSVAFGYVPADLARPAGKFEIEINGERSPAEIIARALYDSSGARMRG